MPEPAGQNLKNRKEFAGESITSRLNIQEHYHAPFRLFYISINDIFNMATELRTPSARSAYLDGTSLRIQGRGKRNGLVYIVLALLAATFTVVLLLAPGAGPTAPATWIAIVILLLSVWGCVQAFRYKTLEADEKGIRFSRGGKIVFDLSWNDLIGIYRYEELVTRGGIAMFFATMTSQYGIKEGPHWNAATILSAFDSLREMAARHPNVETLEITKPGELQTRLTLRRAALKM